MDARGKSPWECQFIKPRIIPGLFFAKKVAHLWVYTPVYTPFIHPRAGYKYTPYSSLERVIEDNKDLYYIKLKEAQTEDNGSSVGLESWVTFFLDCLVKQKNSLKKKIEKEHILKSLPKLSEQILILLKEHNKLSVGEIVKLTGANRNTVKSHIFSLVEGGEINKGGRGKGTYYFI
jgi:Fic family protein